MVETSSRWLDRLVIGGLAFIIVLTPIAFGSVHRWAFVTMETVIFILFAAWMAKLCVEAGGPMRGTIDHDDVRRLLTPGLLLAAMIALQLVPLPPTLIRLASPATYRLYERTLPGWPARPSLVPPESAPSQSTGAGRVPIDPRLLSAVGQGGKRPVAAPPPASSSAISLLPRGTVALARWRTLSIAPGVTRDALVEVAACGALFFLVLLYPPGLVEEAAAETRYTRWMVLTVFSSAVLVAAIGLAERAWWNGRILWFFVPLDWGMPLLYEAPRASGPFVNPDHFANYLAMVLPLAVVGALFPLSILPSRRQPQFRLACAIVAVMVTAGIMLSLSRGGWLAAGLAVLLALALSFRNAHDRAPALLRRLGAAAVPFAIAGFVATIMLVLYMVGPTARTYLGSRVDATVLQGDTLSARPGVWRDTFGMIRDFPLFGVGLGAWPDLFPHFHRPPYFPYFFREAENDYLQFLAETGIAGSILLLWFGFEAVRRLRRVAGLSHRQWPLYAALVAGVVALLVHEFFDFALHTPANAVLFVTILALAIRLSGPPETPTQSAPIRTVAIHPHRTYFFAGVAALLALGLSGVALIQKGEVFPYNIGVPSTVARAEADIAAHPAFYASHLELALIAARGRSIPLAQEQAQTAVWLNPSDPAARDLYAREFLLSGDKQNALDQVEISVANSPELATHYYLQAAAIPWLLPDEQSAIDRGFYQALAAGYDFAFAEFANYCILLGRYHDAGEAIEHAARRQSDDQARAADLTKAGSYFAWGHDYHDAERVLRAAIDLNPSDPKPYHELARWVLVPQKKISAAKALVDDGISRGGDPFELNAALAQAAEDVHDDATAAEALKRALHYRSSYPQIMDLGTIYLRQGSPDKAVAAYRQATDLQPDSAAAFNALAQAEEAAYDYSAAATDYRHAAELDPGNHAYRQNFLDFQRRTAKSTASG